MRNKPNSYGQKHRDERAKKIQEVREREGKAQCEVTGDTERLEGHHSTPRLFNGPDIKSNYQILSSHFHQQVLHATCNVTDREKVKERVSLTKRLVKNIHNEEKRVEIHQRIDELDNELIDEYISNLMNKMQHQYRERVIHLTLVNSFKSVRDLHIENYRLEQENELLKKKLEAYEANSRYVGDGPVLEG